MGIILSRTLFVIPIVVEESLTTSDGRINLKKQRIALFSPPLFIVNCYLLIAFCASRNLIR